MPDSRPEQDFYDAACREAFGEAAASVQRFLRAHRRRGTKPEDPRRDFDRTLRGLFNDGLLLATRAAAWAPLEEARRRGGLTQDQVAEPVGLVSSTYSKVQSGLSTLESILLLLRPLRGQLRDMPLLAVGEQTIAGLLYVLPLVKFEALGHPRPAGGAGPALSREDLEWLLLLARCGQVWVRTFVGHDAEAGAIVAACVAAAIGVRLGQAVAVRPFGALAELWTEWYRAWELCMGAIPTATQV